MKRKAFIHVIGALVVAALFATVCVGSAAATTLCGNNLNTTSCGTPYAAGTTVTLALTNSMVVETNGGTTLSTCTGTTVQGKTAAGGSPTETVKVPIESWSWSGCTKHTTTDVNGEIEIHHISGTDNATMTAKNTQFTTSGWFNNEICIYGAGTGMDMGTIVGGSPAMLNVNVPVPRQAGSGPFCPAEMRWTMNLKITGPNPMYFSAG